MYLPEILVESNSSCTTRSFEVFLYVQYYPGLSFPGLAMLTRELLLFRHSTSGLQVFLSARLKFNSPNSVGIEKHLHGLCWVCLDRWPSNGLVLESSSHRLAGSKMPLSNPSAIFGGLQLHCTLMHDSWSHA